MPNAIVWFRNDLRLADNPALQLALDEGYAPICVYIHAANEEGDWSPGAASNAWRHRSLHALDADLRKRGSHLRVFHGPALATLQVLATTCEAEAVFWNRRYEPAIEARDTRIKRALRDDGLRVESRNASLMLEPWQVQTGSGTPYKVFTPYWRNASQQWPQHAAQAAPKQLPKVTCGPQGIGVDALELAPVLGWDAGFWQHFTPGEQGAHAALEAFLDGALHGYPDGRDRPDRIGTSRLSPHLHFGEIAPWRIDAALHSLQGAAAQADIEAWRRQLGWREFGHHLLHHFPDTQNNNLNPRFDNFAWAKPHPLTLEAWQRGNTGVPIVDAGMRELWHTGWMHNRVRMIVGSWLTKHLRLHWLHGARWFWDTLVDANLANNTMGWQWIAGTGADASPYFRVFNPVTQSQKFDPDARYISQWVPELAKLPTRLKFAPWEDAATSARIAPKYRRKPMVDLAKGRAEALAAYQATG